MADLEKRLSDIEREYKYLKERLDEIKAGIGHIESMYSDLDDRGNEHARRIEEVKKNTEDIMKRLDEHHDAFFKPPESIYLKIDRLEEWRDRVEEHSQNKWPLILGAGGFIISALTFLLTYVFRK